MMKKQGMILVLICMMISTVIVTGDTIPEGVIPIYIIKYQGNTPITNMINSNDPSKMEGILTSESDKVLKFVTFPYMLPNTNITVIKYRCDFTNSFCGFWINATRDGQEVATNSPVWISPPPLYTVVSESYNARKNELTITLKEDPIGATSEILQGYVDRQPLGKAITGTKE